MLGERKRTKGELESSLGLDSIYYTKKEQSKKAQEQQKKQRLQGKEEKDRQEREELPCIGGKRNKPFFRFKSRSKKKKLLSH